MTIRRRINIGLDKAIFTLYFASSILLSVFVVIRLLFTVDVPPKQFNALVYCLLYFMIPMVSIIWLLNKSDQRKMLKSTLLFSSLLIIYAVLFAAALFSPFMPEYLILWFPVPLMMFLHHKWKNAEKDSARKWINIVLASGLVVAVLLPNVTAYVSTSSLLARSASMNEGDKASFISDRVFKMTAFGMKPRADVDYWKFLLSGAGLCGEMAIAGVNLMNAAGLEARRIAFPGEDHVLIEVKVNGTWLVADPGTYHDRLISRAERADQRIRFVGSLSYVVAYTEKGFIELTQQYVSTDTIVIRITRNGESVADAQVVLKHTFRGSTTQLPSSDYTFHTDVDGNVTLHMGKPHYINEFKGSEEYYWICVNGEDTGYNVTSTGTDQIRTVEIDLH